MPRIGPLLTPQRVARVVRAEPFVELDLELRLLWSDPADAAGTP